MSNPIGKALKEIAEARFDAIERERKFRVRGKNSEAERWNEIAGQYKWTLTKMVEAVKETNKIKYDNCHCGGAQFLIPTDEELDSYTKEAE